MTPFQKIAAQLPDAKKSGDGLIARCPAHEDRKPSLSIKETLDGAVLMKCHAGCPNEGILMKVGLTLADLFPAFRRSSTLPRRTTGKRSYPTADAALAAWEKLLGAHATHWDYHDATGQPVGRIIRWDTDTGKEIRPVSHRDGGWVLEGMATPRPLYNLPALLAAQNAKVYVAEGEKCADVLVSMGLLTTTSAHGSASPCGSDWSPLAGRDVVILPDNDSAGEKFAETVSVILCRLYPPASVRVVRLEGLGPGEDVADLVDRNRDTQAGLEVTA